MRPDAAQNREKERVNPMRQNNGVRVVALAGELKIPVKALMEQIRDLGLEVSGTNDIIKEDDVASIRELLGKTASIQATNAKVIEVPNEPMVREIAEAMGIQANVAVKKLMSMGHLLAANQRLQRPLAEKLAAEYGFTIVTKVVAKTVPIPPAVKHKGPSGTPQSRPPVVTIMGHVDHGKTTLLDTIRKTNVVSGEHGGITQHIGAYQIETVHNNDNCKITFLDTPGHKAFTKMRARGASVTDIVILVVAADDGIMPQTVEAIQHAQTAKVPMIVAINKMDKPEARPDRIKQQLTEHSLVVEEYGGDVIAVPLSAKTGDGIPDLLEYILLVSEVQEFKAIASGHAQGTVIEAKTEPGRGPVTTVLVQSGTLSIGDAIVAGSAFGKVRAMTNDQGVRIQKATPSTPVEVLGFNNAPEAGDIVQVVKNEKEARSLAEKRVQSDRATRLVGPARRVTLADLSRLTQDGEIKDLSVIVKADVQGSLEAVIGELQTLEANKVESEVRLVVKSGGVGNISETDVDLASVTNSILVGFNVRLDPPAQRAAERAGIEARLYNVIYDLSADIERAMKGLLTPIYEEFTLGHAEIRQNFRTPRGITIAGSYVTDGKLQRGTEVRLKRGKDLIFTGKIDTLRRVKDDVREVAAGYECGLTIQDFNEAYQIGDILECYEMRQVERT